MGKTVFPYLLILLLSSSGLFGQQESSALFIKNTGQWDGDFQYKLRLNSGALFFTPNSISINVAGYHEEKSHTSAHPHHKKLEGIHSVKIEFAGSNPDVILLSEQKCSFYHNYYRGSDESNWRSKVPVYRGIRYQNLYAGIDFNYFGKGDNLKYDISLKPGADPTGIRMRYNGASKLELKEENLHIRTAYGDIIESIPEAYQFIGGEKVTVKCTYLLQGNEVGFKLGKYNPDYELIIDPELVFSTFSGSTADNWGFTATYDHNGNLYGGGIVFNDGGTYPTTTGVVQSTFGGSTSDVDIAISKFSTDGKQLLFATYLGGSEIDIPHSLVADENNDLYILGNTGSLDYPVSQGAWQTNFGGGTTLSAANFYYSVGTDIIISKIREDGTALTASTFLGGSGNDGVNLNIYKNYGDQSRGEIICNKNSVYLVSSTHSNDFPTILAHQDVKKGIQDAVVACFNPALDNLKWSTYFGGASDESGYSIKLNGQSKIVIGGATRSSDLTTTPGSAQPNHQGGLDGFLAIFHALNGSYATSTYVGSNGEDQVFLLDMDQNDQVYCVGQSNGSITQSPGVYGDGNSRQFIKKYDPQLQSEIWSTRIGSGQNKYDLVPTAFMIDKCHNIYLSGWNGTSNQTSTGPSNGNTNNLPVTSDAWQQSTDGSDFYFMVLNRDAKSLKYASYFGGSANEHVDGGTSRFDPEGTIYQAVCAGCGLQSFPTTPSVYSENNMSNNCNLGVLKLNFETSVQSKPSIDYTFDIDTICDSLIVRFSNESVNADAYFWDFGNGQTSTDSTPVAVFQGLGTYTVKLIASDTVCSVSDTTELIIEHKESEKPLASFTSEYIGCDKDFIATFKNTSEKAHVFHWNFGDGTTANLASPTHQFPDTGNYVVNLTVWDTVCNTSNTFTDTIHFMDTTVAPVPMALVSDCGDGTVDVLIENDRNRFSYHWDFGNGEISNDKYPSFQYTTPGKYNIILTLTDTTCQENIKIEFPVEITEIGVETFIPSAFTPNNDGKNEELKIFGNSCKGDNSIIIFNRWGEIVFESDQPFDEFWDAKVDGKEAPEGVYIYRLVSDEKITKGTFTLFR